MTDHRFRFTPMGASPRAPGGFFHVLAGMPSGGLWIAMRDAVERDEAILRAEFRRRAIGPCYRPTVGIAHRLGRQLAAAIARSK